MDQPDRVALEATLHSLAPGRSARKFRDTLTGRKAELWLTPAMSADLEPLGVGSLQARLHRGGLPPFLLQANSPEREYQEWMDAYWA